jgi:hypothetical protein
MATLKELNEKVAKLEKEMGKQKTLTNILLHFIQTFTATNEYKVRLRRDKKNFQRDLILQILFDNDKPGGLRTVEVHELLPVLNRKQIHNGLTQMAQKGDERIKRPGRGFYKFGRWIRKNQKK